MKLGFTIRKILLLAQSLMIAALLLYPVLATSDQAQYFYDELGRLVGVQDSQGNMAVYTYDEVGNLLAIQRFGAGTGIGIFLLAPSKGLVGSSVEIRGFGFLTTPGDNQVAFNGTAATVDSATTESLVVTVPAGATTGSVTVTNTNGTATSPQAFTVLVPPIIAGVSPEKVIQGKTTQVAIAGFNLADASGVTFTQSGITAALRPGATSQSLPINLTVASSVPAGSYSFSVTTPAGTAQSGEITVTVTPPVPSFEFGPLSVFRPFSAQTPPSGPTFTVAPGLSVEVP